MRCKNDMFSDMLQRVVKIQPIPFHLFTDQLNACKQRVAVVEMVDINVNSEFAQGTDSAYAEEHFLCNALFFEPSVKLAGQTGVLLRQAGIQKIKRDVSVLFTFPHFGLNLPAADQHLHGYTRIFQKIIAVIGEAVVKGAVSADNLVRITLPPQDADADHGVSAVFGGL